MPSRRVCVSGASRGIGRAISENLTNSGYDVIGIARNRPADWKGSFWEVDLETHEGISEVRERIASLDDIWALVNNAGVGAADSVYDIDLPTVERVFHLNTFVPALLTSSACERMVNGGRVVNIGSVVSLGQRERTSYGGSKAALQAMTRSWALDVAANNITVNCICPGPVETELFRSRNPVGSTQESRYLASIPLARFAAPREIADLVRFLISDSAAFMTGQAIYIDGGMSVNAAKM